MNSCAMKSKHLVFKHLQHSFNLLHGELFY